MWFPTEEWLKEYRRRLNENEEFARAAKGWGVDFNGDYIFEITDLPVDEYRVKDLPDELYELRKMPDSVWDGVPENVQNQMIDQMGDLPVYDLPDTLPDNIRQALPEDLQLLIDDLEKFFDENPTQKESPQKMTDRMRNSLSPDLEMLVSQLEHYVTDDNKVYSFVGLEDGRCTEAEVLTDPNSRQAGFVLRGPYENWVDLIEGMDVVEAVMSGRLELDGDMQQILKYSEASQQMGDTAASIETDYIFR